MSHIQNRVIHQCFVRIDSRLTIELQLIMKDVTSD